MSEPSNQLASDAARRGEFRLTPDAKRGTCRACGAELRWIRSPRSGKPVPLSAATIRRDSKGAQYALSHFADCPQAGKFRKRG